jgi:tetratricopeptide (TPR) repeat protein
LGSATTGWGEYGQAIDLHTQALAIARQVDNRQGEGADLGNLGNCYYCLGEYGRAIDFNTQALAIARETGDREGESTGLGNLGNCYYSLGEYPQAIDLHTQALAIARDISNRYLEANSLGYMGRTWLASGDARQALALFEQAVSIADATGDVEPAVEARSWLARAHLQLGDVAAALAVTTVERDLTYPPEEPAMHLLEGLALLELNHPDESAQALNEALASADALLAHADRNVAALEVRALALSGLAVVAGDPARAAEAAEAFARARAVTTAPGVVADTRRLLDLITKHDGSGLLTAIGSGSGS